MNSHDIKKPELDLWAAADSLRANSGLKSSEYAAPMLTRLMKNAITEHKRQKQRMAAMDKILEITAGVPPVDRKVLKQARLEGRP